MIPEKQRKEMLRELAKTEAGAAFTCDSGSMHPTIVVGETVRIKAVARADLQVGDVVVYEGKDGIYMLHRIVLISSRRSWFLHMGDAKTLAGPRRAMTASIVGRTDHPRKLPKKRVVLLAFPRALLRRGIRLLRR